MFHPEFNASVEDSLQNSSSNFLYPAKILVLHQRRWYPTICHGNNKE